MSVIGKNYGKPTLDLNFAGNKSLIDTTTGTNYVTFTRAQSGNEATYVGSDGLIKYASADEPRFDHDPVTGDSLGLLVEELRTNLLSYSEDFTQWTSNNTGGTNPIVTPNTIIAPDGTLTADSVFYTSSSAALNAIYATPPSPGLTQGVSYTFSVYLKVASGTATIPIGIGDDNNIGNDIGINCNLTTSWQRFSVTFTKGTGTLSGGVIGWYTNWREQGTGTPIPVGPNVDTTIHAWGAQLEQGSFPTSYIPTSGSTETRAADEASMTASPYLYGTFFAKYKHHPGNNNFRQIFTVGSSNAYTAFVCRTTPAGSANIVLPNITELASTANSETSGINIAATTRVIGDYAVCLNGGTVATSSSTSDNSNNSVITFMYGTIGAVSGGHISRFTYWPKRLPDIELQQLTK